MLLLFICGTMSIIFNYDGIGVFSNVGRKLPIYSVDTSEKKIALTFDVSWGLDNTDESSNIFRCPSGTYNDNVIDTLKEINHYCIQWDVDSMI